MLGGRSADKGNTMWSYSQQAKGLTVASCTDSVLLFSLIPETILISRGSLKD